MGNVKSSCIKSEKKDIANDTELYPVIVANPIFRNLHKELLYNIGRFLETRKISDRTLLILGLSPIASPYGNHKRWVMEHITPKGKIIALDYNPKIIAKAFNYLSSEGFFEKGFFYPKIFSSSDESLRFLAQNCCCFNVNHENQERIQNMQKEAILEMRSVVVSKDMNNVFSSKNNSFSYSSKISKINPRRLRHGGILFSECNLNYGVPLESNSVDCIDATLTLHHVASYRKQLNFVLKDIFRVLKKGGLFHLGDAFVDMRGSERKINKIMNILSSIVRKEIMLYDCRDSDWRVCAKYKPLIKYPEIPLFKRINKREFSVLSTEELFHNMPVVELIVKANNCFFHINFKEDILDKKNDFVNALLKIGYTIEKQFLEKDYPILEFPLIDMKIDILHVKNVVEFQDLVRELKKGLYATTNFNRKLIDEAIIRGDKEREYAINGLYEYFSSKEFLIEMLKEAGFRKIQIEMPNRDAGYPVEVGAILAYK